MNRKYLVRGLWCRFDHFRKTLLDTGHRCTQGKGVFCQNTALQGSTACWHSWGRVTQVLRGKKKGVQISY